MTGLRKRNKRSLILSVFVVLGLVACGGKDSDNESPQKGIWQQKGYGRIWQFEKGKLTIFSHNAKGCVRESHNQVSELEATGQFKIKTKHDNLIISGPAAKNYVLEPLDALPKSCKKPLNGNQDKLVNFDFYWQMMNENYAFFSEHGVDWQAIYRTQRPRIAAATTEQELAQIYEDIISQIPDAHVSFSRDRESAFYGEGKRNELTKEWHHNPYFAATDDASFAQFMAYQQSVVDKLLLPETRKTSADVDGYGPAIVWGEFAGDMGYLRVHRVAELRRPSEGLDLASLLRAVHDDVNYVDELMPTILHDLASTKAMVIDLRFNLGGDDQVGLRVAQYFNKQKKIIASSHTRANATRANVMLDAVQSPYEKPIFILTGSGTASAAEVMTLALQTLPNATLIGEATHGVFSDVLAVSLPGGGYFGLSNEIYLNNAGEMPEGKGVQPQYEMPAYANFDLQAGVPTPLAFVLQKIEWPKKMASAETLQKKLEALRQQGNITGLSAAVIRGDTVVFENAVGLADIAHNVAMTADTPVSLASISKTFIGTHLMQNVEQGKINLDVPLSTVSLDFRLDNPMSAPQLPTLRQLATHTSGIVDDATVYGCQYFVEGDNTSLYAYLMPENNPCTQAPITSLRQFLPAYLSRNGSLYQSSNFVAAPGEQWAYSNIASALAGYAIEAQTGTSVVDSMKQQLLAPLAMHNTAWSRDELTTIEPARLYTRLLSADPDEEATVLPHYRYPDIYSGGLWSSAHDLANYLNAIMHGGELNGVRVLSAANVTAMLSAQTALSPHQKQGLFWLQTGSFYGHTGGDPGTTTFMFYNPHTEVGFVLLLNQDSVERVDPETGYSLPEQPLFDIMTALYRYGLGY